MFQSSRKFFFLARLSRVCPALMRRIAAITSITPVNSFAMIFPFIIPLANFVLGLSRSDCRANRAPIIFASELISSAVAEVGPICAKKQSLQYLKIPSKMAWSSSQGVAPWIPLSLWSPNRRPWKAFFINICDRSASLSALFCSKSLFNMGSVLNEKLAWGSSVCPFGHVQYLHSCFTPLVRDR